MRHAPASERVWDPFARVFHWSLVGLVVLNLWVLEEGEAPHEWAGYAAITLVLLRVVWGFIGLTIMNPLIIDMFDVPVGLCVLNSGIILQTQGLTTSAVLAMTGLILFLTAIGDELSHYRITREKT